MAFVNSAKERILASNLLSALMEFLGYYNNGLHIYRMWKIRSYKSTSGYETYYELWE